MVISDVWDLVNTATRYPAATPVRWRGWTGSTISRPAKPGSGCGRTDPFAEYP
jgi:hypothetical protein